MPHKSRRDCFRRRLLKLPGMDIAGRLFVMQSVAATIDYFVHSRCRVAMWSRLSPERHCPASLLMSILQAPLEVLSKSPRRSGRKVGRLKDILLQLPG